MRKYYYKDANGQQFGPVKLDVLKTKSLTPEMPVWYDPLLKWTTAGEVDELKSFILQGAPMVKEEIKTSVEKDVKPVSTLKRLYYYKDANGQQFGPVKLDVLKTKSLTTQMPVWYDPLPKWTTAGEVEELKSSTLQETATRTEEIKKPVAVDIKLMFDPKRLYYYKDANGQQFGPIKLDVLKTKSLTAQMPVWYDPLPKWTTADAVDELKSFLPHAEPVIAEEIKPASVAEMKEDPKLTVVETPVAEKIITETPIVNSPVAEIIIAEKPAETITPEVPVIEKKIEVTPVVEDAEIAEVTEVVEPVEEIKIESTPVVSEPVIPKVAEVVAPVAESSAAKLPATEKATVSISSTASVATAPSISVAPVVKPVLQPVKQISKKKNTAWISWVLSLLVLGVAGYFVYDNIEKNKNGADNITATEISPANEGQTSNATTPDLSGTEKTTPDTAAIVQPPVATTLTTTTTNTAKAELEKKALLKKKADEEKKKQLAIQADQAKQQAEEQKKQEVAAQAALEKELQFRNGWAKYITLGSLNYAPKGGDDGVNSFDIPVYNGTDAMIDRVVVKIDYFKKESKDKSLHTETVIITNIPPKSGKSGVAPENKRARVAKATITGVNSRKLHLCYPSSNGNSADPYYCN